MKNSLTVGELKQALEGVADSLPVYVTLELSRIKPFGGDFDWYVTSAKHSPNCSIANEHFNIEIGESFGW